MTNLFTITVNTDNGDIVIDVDILNFDRLLYQQKWVNEYLKVRNEPLRYSVSEVETVQMMLTKDWFTSLLKELIETNGERLH